MNMSFYENKTFLLTVLKQLEKVLRLQINTLINTFYLYFHENLYEIEEILNIT